MTDKTKLTILYSAAILLSIAFGFVLAWSIPLRREVVVQSTERKNTLIANDFKGSDIGEKINNALSCSDMMISSSSLNIEVNPGYYVSNTIIK